MRKVVLASQSPRRRELLASVGINFTTTSSDSKEIFDPSLSVQEAVQQVALQKALMGVKHYPNDCVVGADTIVVIDGKILGKHKDQEEAKAMLSLLSGRVHHVYTGVAICDKGEWETFCEDTEVTFYDLDESLIDSYIATKEYKDKAGGYGIQGKGMILVKKIHGDYNNVVGLPVSRLYRHLQKYIRK